MQKYDLLKSILYETIELNKNWHKDNSIKLLLISYCYSALQCVQMFMVKIFTHMNSLALRLTLKVNMCALCLQLQ